MKTLVDKVQYCSRTSQPYNSNKEKKNTNETVRLIQGTYNINYTSKAEKQNKTKKSTYLKSLTREVTMHIRNAQGGPLISVFDLASGFNSNFSFTLNFSFQKNVVSWGLRLNASSTVNIVSCNQKIMIDGMKQGFQQGFKQVGKALELAVKERNNGTGKNSWHDLQVPKAQVTREVQGHAPWKNFEIWASQSTFPAFWSV